MHIDLGIITTQLNGTSELTHITGCKCLFSTTHMKFHAVQELRELTYHLTSHTEMI